MDDCHSSATVRTLLFQTLLCMDTKKIAMILSNITFLLLFLQDIGGILEMWAAQGSHSLFNLPTSSPRSRSRFQLGKTAWFLHFCHWRARRFALPQLLEQTFLTGNDLHFGSALLTILAERNLPIYMLAILPTEHHQVCPSAALLQGLGILAA